jgi:hypothetical protein
MLSKSFPQVSRKADVKVAVFLALQNVDIIHGYFTGFDGADTAARLNCEVKLYNSSSGKCLLVN